MAGVGPEINQLNSTVQAVRHEALEGSKKITPDKKHDKQFLIIALVFLVLIVAVCFAIPYIGTGLEWLLGHI